MQRTFSLLLVSQCRSRTHHLVSDVFSVEKSALIDYESCHRRLHCLFNTGSPTRQISESRSYSETKDTVKDMSQWWIDYKKRRTYKERCISRISASLRCNDDVSELLVDADPLTFLDKIDEALKKIEYLREQGISSECIRKNISVISLSESELQLRMKCLKTWEIDEKYLGDFLPILKLQLPDFIFISNSFVKEKQKNIPDGNRMIHFAKLLDFPLMQVNRAFIRSRLLFRVDFDRVKSSILCYQEFGVKSFLILKDVSGLRVDPDIIRKRLSGPFENGLHPLRPNLVICSEFTYKRRLKELEKNCKDHGLFKNPEEYLMDKLFSKKHHLSAHKQQRILQFLMSVDPKTLVDVIEFFLERNYVVDQICSNLQIFNMDVHTLEERYNRLTKLGVDGPSTFSLTKNPDDFEEFAKRVEFNKNAKKDIIDEMVSLIANSKN